MGHGLMTVDYTVWCGIDDCPCWMYAPGNNKKSAALYAELHDWKQSRKYGWLCPVHAVDQSATSYEAKWWDDYSRMYDSVDDMLAKRRNQTAPPTEADGE